MFYACSNLSSVTIPKSVTEIGKYAFYKCSCLKKIIIPKNVTWISDDAFEGLENLEIHGEKDSYAREYAKKNNITFVEK